MTTKVAVTETAGPKVTVNEAGEVLVSIATGSVTIQGGLGDVVGPASATDNAIARFDLATGKLIQNSGITIADGATGVLSGANTGDQNIFQTIAVSGQSNVVAGTTADTLTLVAGSNISITTDATADSVTINSTVIGLTDGNKGDIVVSGSGTAWDINSGAVTAGKMASTLDLSGKIITIPAIVTADSGTDSLQINDDTNTAMVQFGKDGTNNGTVGMWDATNSFIVSAAAVDGGWSLDGNMTAVAFIGNGSQLGNMSANNISAGTLALARGGTGSLLTDPNADRILFWDDSAGQVTWLAASTGLSISGTNITVSNAVLSGAGSPESVVTAPVGTLYTRTDGGAGSTLYVKESGSGNTGWIAK